MHPGITVQSEHSGERLSCRLLTALSAQESITLDGRGGDGRDAGTRLFKKEFS